MSISGVNGRPNIPENQPSANDVKKEDGKEVSIFDTDDKDGTISVEEQKKALKEAAENNLTVQEAVKRGGFSLDMCLSMLEDAFSKVLIPMKGKIQEFDAAFKAKIDAYVDVIAEMASKMTGAEYTKRTTYGNHVVYTTTRDGQVVHRHEMSKNGQHNVVGDYDGDKSRVFEYDLDVSMRYVVQSRLTKSDGDNSVTEYYGENNKFLGSEEIQNQNNEDGSYSYTIVKKDANNKVVSKEVSNSTPYPMTVVVDGEERNDLNFYTVEIKKYDAEGNLVEHTLSTPIPEWGDDGQIKTVVTDLLKK